MVEISKMVLCNLRGRRTGITLHTHTLLVAMLQCADGFMLQCNINNRDTTKIKDKGSNILQLGSTAATVKKSQ